MRAIARFDPRGLIAVVVAVGYAAYRIWDQGNRDERPRADAIVVMGAAQYDGRPSPVFAARLDHAIDLFHGGRAVPDRHRRQAARATARPRPASARAYAIARDVPGDAILAEDRSRTTLQSIRGVAALMRDHGLETAVFVSDPSHMLRVLRMATDEGMRPTVRRPGRARSSMTRSAPSTRSPTSWVRLPSISCRADRNRSWRRHHRRRVGRLVRSGGGKYPLGAGGLAAYTGPKPADPGTARVPRQVAPQPSRPCPALQMEGVR